MKKMRRIRLTAMACAAALLMTLFPVLSNTNALAATVYGQTTASGVRVRKSPSTTAVYWFKVDAGWQMEVTDVVVKDGVTWYKVNSTHPESTTGSRIYVGYVHGDYFTLLDSSASTSTSSSANTTTTNTVVNGTGSITSSGVNFRALAGGEDIKTHASMMKLDRGTVVELISIPSVIDSSHWYRVKYNGYEGYIQAPYIKVLTTGSTTTTTTTTAAPTAATTSTVTGVTLKLSSANLRITPGGTIAAQWEKTGQTLPVTAGPTKQDGYTWYQVLYNKKNYWVRSDTVTVVTSTTTTTATTTTAATTTAAAVTPTPTPTTIYGYVRTTKSSVNLRAKPAGSVLAKVDRGLVLAVTAPTQSAGGYTWYQVTVNGKTGYLRSDCVTVTDESGNAVSSTVASDDKIYLKTNVDKVNLRASATKDSTALFNVALNTYLVADKKLSSGGSTWYRITYNSKTAYVLGSVVTVVSAADYTAANPTTTSTTTTTTTSTTYTPATKGQEASYKNLKRGSTGSAVKALIQELKNQGYYTGTVGSTYTAAVETAVKAFQKANSLTVDGIAGPITQHALFQTIPVGSSDVTDLSMAIYPAEKIDWYTGGINELWARGANYKVYDVKTGIVWWAHRWAGGSHVDAEPLTAADTARLCAIYGVSSSGEIASKNLWQRRPCLVTIGTRTFACSLYGVPHNYPDGDTISDNDFKGQLCIHFTNSKTHTSNKVDANHEEAINYAYENAPNGHK